MNKGAFRQLLFYWSSTLFSVAIYFLLAPVATVIFLYRCGVILACRIVRPNLDTIVTGIDAIFGHNVPDKSDSVIVTSFVLRKSVTEHRLREMFEQRIFNLKDSQGQLIYKRLFQYWSEFCGYTFWKTDDHFNICNHVKQYDHITLGLPTPLDEATIKLVLPKLAENLWMPKRSHWEALIVPSYKPPTCSTLLAPPCTLLIFRFDHLLLDGLSTIALFRALLLSKFETPKPRLNGNRLTLLQRLNLFINFPFHMLKPLPIYLKGSYLGKRNTSECLIYDFTENIPVSVIQSIKKKFDVEFAAVVFAAVNGALCRCVHESGKDVPSEIDVLTPIPLPDHPGGLCNYFTTFMEHFPLKATSASDLICKTDKILKTTSKDESVFAAFFYFDMLGKLPAKFVRKIISSTSLLAPSLIISVLPTTTSTDYFDDAEIVDTFYFTTPPGQTGMTVTSWGTSNQQRFSFVMDKDLGNHVNVKELSRIFTQEIKTFANI